MKILEITVDDILDKFPSSVFMGDYKIWFFVNDQVAEYALVELALQKASIGYKMGYTENVDNDGDDYVDQRFFEVNDNDENYIKHAPKAYLKYHDTAINQAGLSENGLVYDISSIN